VPGSDGGALDADQLAWLDAQLAASPQQPTLVFMHHLPFRTRIPYMDKIGLDAASAGYLARSSPATARSSASPAGTCIATSVRAGNGITVSIW